MSMTRMILYFDYRSFLDEVSHILATPDAESINKLRKLAEETSSNYPKVWKILDFYGISPEADDFKENSKVDSSRVAFWLVLIMSRYCSIVDKPLDFRTISGTLNQAGIDKDLISNLATGKPFSSMFLSLEQSLSNSAGSNSVLNEIDNFPAGWLTIEDIENTKREILEHRSAIDSLIYDRLLTMLDTAIHSGQGLILGISV